MTIHELAERYERLMYKQKEAAKAGTEKRMVLVTFLARFPDYLPKLREPLTQEQMAEGAGVDVFLVKCIENGKMLDGQDDATLKLLAAYKQLEDKRDGAGGGAACPVPGQRAES